MEVFRITHQNWATQLYGSGIPARWNSGSVAVIYSAASRSLACLENIVHRNTVELTDLFRTMVIYIPDGIDMAQITNADLPRDWHMAGEKYYRKTRPEGDKWVQENKYLVCKVPSAIIRNEFNYLINPAHPDFKKIKLISTEAFFFDSRIKNR